MFRELEPYQEQQFRQWARDNYEPFTDIKGMWHFIVQDECAKINLEKSKELNKKVLGED